MAKKYNAMFLGKKLSTAHQHQNLIPIVKNGAGGIMVWNCFAAWRPGHLTITERSMNSKLYEDILHENIRATVHDLKLKGVWVMQQDS